MGRAEFEYDEVGNTFYYVLLAFYALVLVPCTYFFFPSGAEEEVKVDDRLCQCLGDVDKRKRKNASKPWKKTKKVVSIVGLAVAWIILAMLVQKVSTIENTHVEYDPYTILELDQGAPTSEVKKAYRDLSKKYHPDRGGDAVQFDRIAKAYQALTDDESRENWEKYGNPDGPTATTFGIALPKWLVSKEYGLWVLAFYGLVFMIILPIVVGTWWYNSIKYNNDKVLLDTTQLFGYFLRKTPRMEINRAIMIMGGAFEFNKDYNSEIILRQTDDVELPRLMKKLPLLGENKKERPLCLPYALKARIMLHAHLSRLPLDTEHLLFDQRYTISRCYRLIEEMVSIAQQITYYTNTKIPVETFENLLRLMPMIVQALWPKNSALLQLPHLNDSVVNYLRRQKVATTSDLAKLENDKRRQLLNALSDAEYRDVVIVLTSMPRLHIETSFEVPGEDDSHEVTAGCFATLKVKLIRRSLLDPSEADDDAMRMDYNTDDESGAESRPRGNVVQLNDEFDGEMPATPEENVKKRKAWEKPQAKKKGGAKKKAAKIVPKKTGGAAVPVPAASTTNTAPATPSTPSTDEKKRKEKKTDAESEDQPLKEGEESGSEGGESDEESKDSGDEGGEGRDESDEDEWVAETKKPVLETKSYETHPVHCPFYPGEKFEWWWLTLSYAEKKKDKGMRRLLCPIASCKTLVDEQTVEMRFPAPETKGAYILQLSVHSDSYVDCVYALDIKLDVKPAKEVVLPKYEDTEDEEEVAVESSDEYTEESDSDE